MAVLRQFPGRQVVVLEKEPRVAAHQTGHNSGVIHSGIYYRPGSLKAILCVRGGRAMVAFCQTHGISYLQCGKVVLAATPDELPRLDDLHQRGRANGVPHVALISRERLRELEPAATGVGALHIPGVGIVDYAQVAYAMAQVVMQRGGVITTSARVIGMIQEARGIIVRTTVGDVRTRAVINCGGLHADRVATMTCADLPLHIIPFRGEYYDLVPEQCPLVRGLIYPTPDPQLPFLGVHLTRMVDGRVEAGPSAVLALAREGYRKTSVNLSEVAAMARFPGFWRMAARHWRDGWQESWCSISKTAFVRRIQRLVPAIQARDLIPAPAGVRAQAVDRAGRLLDDFHLVQQPRLLHVCNAPSPAATASLAIGEHVATVAAKAFGWV